MNVALRELRASLALLTIALLAVFSAGCSGRPKNIARSVTGKVTLGGQPLAGAVVVFTPVEGGSASMGKTDESGNYKLVWARSAGGRSIEGAQIGEHTVSISTFQEAVPSSKPPIPEVPEKVPYKYRVTDPPKVTVKKGSNVIDIPLEEGPTEPPPPAKAKKGKR